MSGGVTAFSVAVVLGQAIRVTVPYVGAALGGVWSERSGVVNIALEGTLLVTGLTAVAVTHQTGLPILGVMAALFAGALVATIHGVLTIWGRVDAIVSGIALNLMAAGGTRFALRALYGSSSNSPSVKGFDSVSGVLGALVDPFVVASIAATVLSMFVLQRSRFGLEVRAVGDHPVAAATQGVAVSRVRMGAVVLGGVLCGLGGAALSMDQRQFQAGMSGGRGFIALACVVLSGWRPGRAALVCLGFAVLDAIQMLSQSGGSRGGHPLMETLPYAFTLLSLMIWSRGRGRAPSGMGVWPEG